MNALLVSSGDINNYKALKNLASTHDFIICADGGIRHLIQIGIDPDIIIGDLDSIDKNSMDYIRDKKLDVIKYPVQKDETDTELAIIYLIDKGYEDITLVGVTGSRIDHTLSNIFLLKNLSHKNIKAKIIDDNNIIYFVDSDLKLKRDDKYYVSVIPIIKEGVVVSLKGFLYPLVESRIQFGSSLGVSNRITSDYGEIIIHSGEAMIIVAKD